MVLQIILPFHKQNCTTDSDEIPVFSYQVITNPSLHKSIQWLYHESLGSYHRVCNNLMWGAVNKARLCHSHFQPYWSITKPNLHKTTNVLLHVFHVRFQRFCPYSMCEIPSSPPSPPKFVQQYRSKTKQSANGIREFFRLANDTSTWFVQIPHGGFSRKPSGNSNYQPHCVIKVQLTHVHKCIQSQCVDFKERLP